ncbi:MAG: DNA-binding response regulator [Acidobacteria bacterium]|nr:MAG: DNA-binding response regulator [Acidobacteriota bacterium]REJ97974.1 MAG: DNA-binding response regulator [Acidobacteriota bacterium]REK16717.1 MAG: DNA-binding response regulator [Acidobacteriota bacterium]REK42628.1 MAG: DNA-binding response regulator [Acidobacteriota bacterium]
MPKSISECGTRATVPAEATMSVRVLLVENQEIVRLGVRTALSDDQDIELVAEAATGAEGLKVFSESNPDVVVLSLRLPDACAVDDIDKYLASDPKARLLVLADHSGDSEIAKSIKKGALGYVDRNVSAEELVRAVKVVAAGSKFIPERIASILTENLGAEELTNAEHRTLEMLVGGMSNKEIGFALDVSENTVKTHVKNIFGKLGVSDRTSATTTAIKRGLVRIDV